MDYADSKTRYIVHTGSDERIAQYWMAEGIRSYRVYEESGELRQLDDAIEYAKEGSGLTVQSHESRAEFLSIIGIFLGVRYERTGEMKDIEDAIDQARRAVQSTQPDHPDLAGRLNNLRNWLRSRFERSGEIKDLEEAIDIARHAVQLTPPDHTNLADRLNNLGSCLGSRFERSGEIDDLEEAIDIARQVVQSTPPDHPDLAIYLNNLGNRLGSRFERSGEVEDLEEAINIARQAVQSTPSDHPNLAGRLNNLGNWLGSRFERSREMKDLEEAINIARQAVQSTPPDHPDLAGCLNNLGNWLGSRFERSGEIKDLEEAINTARQAVQSTPSDHPDLAMYLNNLGSWLGSQFERSAEIKDLKEAIKTARQAVLSTPSDHPGLAMYLSNLGSWLGSQFEQSGEIKDLEEAIMTAGQAVKSTPPDHPNLAGCLNNLGNWLGSRFERSGEMKDLEEAINIARQAVQSTPPDHPDLAMYLNNLGNRLGSQFGRSGEIKDLEEAIVIARQAVQSTPPDHPDLAMYLNNLGNRLGSQFERSEEMKDLEEAIVIARQAVQSTPSDHPDLAIYLNNLGNWLGSRFERSREIKDLEEAINIARQAVQSTPPDHTNLAGRLNNLGSYLGSRFERSGEIDDLEEAIDIARQVVQSTPPDHPDLAMYLNNLGNRLGSQFERSKEMKDLKEVTKCYLGAFDCTSAAPLDRVKAVARCLSKLADLGETHRAVKLGREALDLLPTVNNRNLDRSDQQFVLTGFTGIASDLCALLLSRHCVHEAVECLEQGRAVIISRLLDDRSDLSELCRQHPKLAQRYQSLVAEVNTPFGTAEDDSATTARVMRRREAATELEDCLRDIRATTDHDRFLLGQTVAQMQEDTCEGCIVMVNVSTIRSDAIVMTQDTLQAISLSDLNIEDARRWLHTEWKSQRSELRKKNDKFLEYLTWLWRTCVEHILNHVSTLYRGHQGFPRVWWIGCGLASSMPFHAAGIHTNASRDNALSKVISSYTPSAKALSYAHSQIKRTQSGRPTRDRMLITLMPETPQGANDKTRFKPMKGVPAEEEKIAEIVTPHVNLIRTRPDADDVLGRLEDCQISHFACHGMSSLIDPSSSGLVLQRLASDGMLEQDYLSVYRISQLRLRHAKIAYLSACSTAENKGARLQDEVIHIVSGFQVAGFPHVIGSLWPAGDSECVQVASSFYSSLFEHGGVPDIAGRRVAWALQEAVMAVRAQDMDMPLNWAQFVHFGA